MNYPSLDLAPVLSALNACRNAMNLALNEKSQELALILVIHRHDSENRESVELRKDIKMLSQQVRAIDSFYNVADGVDTSRLGLQMRGR